MSARREKRIKSGTENWYWIVDFVFRHADGRSERVRRYSPVNNRSGAEEYERKLRKNLLGADEKPAARLVKAPTVSIFSEDFLKGHAKLENKPSEVYKKTITFKRHLYPFFGRMRLDAIGPKHVADYKAAKIADGLSPKTVNNHLTILRTLLRTAAEWGLIAAAPQVKLLKASLPDFDFLDHGEALRLAEAAGSAGFWRIMIVVALHTGLRIGELIPLRWSNVDLVTRKLRAARSDWMGQEGLPKSGRPRVVPLNQAAWEALQSHKLGSHKLVFWRTPDIKLKYGACYAKLAEICEDAGLRLIGWHGLRHTFASHLAMAGVPLKAIQELLGHGSMDMTLRYAHLSPETRESAVDALMSAWIDPKSKKAWHTNGTPTELEKNTQ